MSAEKKPAIRKRWRYFTRRHAFLAAMIMGGGALILIVLILFLVRLGYVDRFVATQIKETFASYGFRAEIKVFHASVFPPRGVEMSVFELFDAQTNDRIGKIDRLFATIKIEDLYALNLQRNINLQDLRMEGFEVWVNFDNEGTINLAGGTLACTAAIVNNDVVSGSGTISGSGGFTS